MEERGRLRRASWAREDLGSYPAEPRRAVGRSETGPDSGAHRRPLVVAARRTDWGGSRAGESAGPGRR